MLERFRDFFHIKDKRGISPLIATVLMIAFAVALGAVVMNWGRAYVEDTAADASHTSDTRIMCSQNVNLRLAQIGGSPQICYDEGDDEVRVTLQNVGSMDLEGIIFNVFGSEGSGASVDLEESLAQSQIRRFNIEYDSSEHGEIEFVQAVPKILVRGSNTPVQCSSEEEQWEEVLPC